MCLHQRDPNGHFNEFFCFACASFLFKNKMFCRRFFAVLTIFDAIDEMIKVFNLDAFEIVSWSILFCFWLVLCSSSSCSAFVVTATDDRCQNHISAKSKPHRQTKGDKNKEREQQKNDQYNGRKFDSTANMYNNSSKMFRSTCSNIRITNGAYLQFTLPFSVLISSFLFCGCFLSAH